MRVEIARCPAPPARKLLIRGQARNAEICEANFEATLYLLRTFNQYVVRLDVTMYYIFTVHVCDCLQ